MSKSVEDTEPPLASVDPSSTPIDWQPVWFSRRWPIILACLAAVVWCLAYAYFRNQLSNDWNRQNGGGVPYTVF